MVDADDTRVFLAIRDPSMVLVARLPDLSEVEHWPLPSGGAHGMDIDHAGQSPVRRLRRRRAGRGGHAHRQERSGNGRWTGGPDATFFNPASGLVHVAIGEPGLVQSIDPRTGAVSKIATARGAGTTALVAPDRLYVLSPSHGGVLELSGA